MAHTCYYEANLPLGDKAASSKGSKKTRKIELFVSDFFNTHEIYLRIDDDDDRTMRLDKVEARALLDGLSNAMRFLSY
ncbi:MAG: hypothetical protein V1918_05620 [Planctomycetota bacterium]